jgi:hypothetical protein
LETLNYLLVTTKVGGRVTCTTIDIKDLKRVRREALDREMTLKELVNRAIKEYLSRH